MNKARGLLGLTLAASTLAWSACSGGGGTGTGIAPIPQTPLQSRPSTLRQPSALRDGKKKRGSAVLSVKIPKVRRHGRFVSPGTMSISIAQNGTSLGKFNTTASSPSCASSSGGLLCTFSVAPTVGANQVFTVNAYAKTNGGGALLSTGSTTTTVLLDTTTTIAVTMSGVVASLEVTLPTANPPAATATSVPVVVEAKDAAGYTIVGSAAYTANVFVSDGDLSGATSLSVNGGVGSVGVSVQSPSDVITLSYTGQNLGFAAITATTPGGSAKPSSTKYFAPQPVFVSAVGTTINGYYEGISPTPDATTGSYWYSVNNTTLSTYQLVALAPNGTVTTYTAGVAPSTNLPNCYASAIDATGPNGQVWFVTGCSGVYGFINPATGATSAFTLSGSFSNFSEISGSQIGDPAIYATIYDYSVGQWSTVRVDASGNAGPELSNGNSNVGPLVGSTIYYPNGSTLAVATINGSGPSATITGEGQAAFPLSTVSRPTVAPDGSFWDGRSCNITHVVFGASIVSAQASYYTAPASVCSNVGQSFSDDAIVAPDGSIWVTAGGGCCDLRRRAGRAPSTAGVANIFGTLSTGSPSSAPFSTALITSITVGGTTVPFSPEFGTIAPDGNLLYVGAYGLNNTTTLYRAEIAY